MSNLLGRHLSWCLARIDEAREDRKEQLARVPWWRATSGHKNVRRKKPEDQTFVGLVFGYCSEQQSP